ncbi:MAG: methyltransferase domain-containing protein [Candidatus Nitrosocosmicus sp.]
MNDDSSTNKPKNVWSLGSYSEFARFALPVSAHLVRLCNISSPDDRVLDVACGTGNTAITARLITGAKVAGVDFTPELLALAKEEAFLADVQDIEWKEGNVEDLPYEDESFDVVLSSFGHMFAPHPEVAIKEMLRVTKIGGRIVFSTWPSELINGKLFEAMAKHIPSSPDNSTPPPSPMQWGIPEVIQKRLGGSSDNIKDIHFERGVIGIPILSPNHYWKMASTKMGPIINAIQTLKEPQKVESLRNDILKAIGPYIHDNVLRLDYLITRAIKD